MNYSQQSNRFLKELIFTVAAMSLIFWLMNPGLFTGWFKNIIGGSRGDAGIYLYLESIHANKFFTWSSMGFDLPIFYPWKGALGLSDNFLLPGLIAKLLIPIFHNENFVYNLIYASALILNGVVTYYLARKITGSPVTALFAGFVFMCFPYFKFHRGHPQLAFAFWIPLTILASINFIERRNFKSATLIGCAVAGAFFTSVYYAMYSYLLAAVTIFGGICLKFRAIKFRDFTLLLFANIPWILLLVPGALGYIEIKEGIGTNPTEVLIAQSPGLGAYLAPPMSNVMWSNLLHRLSHLEGLLFFGIIPLLLALGMLLHSAAKEIVLVKSQRVSEKTIGMIVALQCFNIFIGALRYFHFANSTSLRALHHEQWVLAQTLWIALALAVGELISIGWRSQAKSLEEKDFIALLFFTLIFFLFGSLGFKEALSETNPAPMLYRFIMQLPGYEGLRALSRMGIVAILSAILLAALGFKNILNTSFRAQKHRYIFVGGLFFVTGLELYCGPNTLAPGMPTPDVYKYTYEIPESTAILALPIRSSVVDGRNFMFWNSLHQYWMRGSNHKIVNGFSGHIPYYHGLVSHELDYFPSRKSLSRLGCLVGVNYVLVNREFRGMRYRKKLNHLIAELPDEIKSIKCDKKKNCLFKVDPIIDTSSISSPELLFPSANAARTLTLSVKPLPQINQDYSMKLVVLEDLKKPVLTSDISITKNSDWKTENIRIPPSSSPINPVMVKIEVSAGSPGVMLKNLHIDTEAG